MANLKPKKKVKTKVKKQSKTSTSSSATSDYRKRRLGVLGGGALLVGGMLATSHLSGGSSSSNSNDNGSAGTGGVTDGTGAGEDSTGSGSSSSSGASSEGTVKSKVIEEPIDNYEEAMEFANREWNKIKRDNGRQLDCQVLGSAKWEIGDWIKVYLPSFDIDGYMYIIRASQSSDGGDWTCNLTLVDYPPGWGKEELKSDDDSDSDSDSDSEDSSGDASSSNSSGESTANSAGDGTTNSTGDGTGANENTDIVDGFSFYK